MYTIFHKLIEKFKDLDITSVVEESISDADLEVVADLNRDQLRAGTNVEGDTLGTYAKATEAYNNQRSTKISGGDTVTLFDTGELYKSITAKLSSDSIDIKSSYKDSILGYLESVYDPFIGLNKDNINYVSNRIKPKIILSIKEKILN